MINYNFLYTLFIGRECKHFNDIKSDVTVHCHSLKTYRMMAQNRIIFVQSATEKCHSFTFFSPLIDRIVRIQKSVNSYQRRRNNMHKRFFYT